MLNKNTTFAIFDDKPNHIRKIASILKQIPHTKIIRELRDSDHLLSYLNNTKSLPDFIIVDIKIGIDYKEGYRVVEEINQQYPNIHLLLCSEYPDTTYLKEVVAKATAKGYINKENLANNLDKAVTKITQGGEYWDELPKSSYFRDSNYIIRESKKRLKEENNYKLSPKEKKKQRNITLADKEIQAYKPQCDIQLEYDLTAHQWLIFKLFAQGKSAQEIADNLYTTKESVNVQKGTIRKRLDINESSDVWFLVTALELGVVEVREFLEAKANITIMN